MQIRKPPVGLNIRRGFRVDLRNEFPGGNQRGISDEVSVITAFWMDIDIKTPALLAGFEPVRVLRLQCVNGFIQPPIHRSNIAGYFSCYVVRLF